MAQVYESGIKQLVIRYDNHLNLQEFSDVKDSCYILFKNCYNFCTTLIVSTSSSGMYVYRMKEGYKCYDNIRKRKDRLTKYQSLDMARILYNCFKQIDISLRNPQFDEHLK